MLLRCECVNEPDGGGKLLTIMTSISGAFTMYHAHAKNLECICLFKVG